LIFAAQLFRRFVYRDYGGYKLAAKADDHYLYYAVSRGLWISCAFVVLLNIVLSGGSYGLSGLFEAVGLIGAVLFWSGMYALLIYFFYGVSRDLYKSMQLPRPATYAGFENKLLVHMHNSFWLVFVVLEAGLLLLCYGVYFLEHI
jgi:hypothetical protein